MTVPSDIFTREELERYVFSTGGQILAGKEVDTSHLPDKKYVYGDDLEAVMDEFAQVVAKTFEKVPEKVTAILGEGDTSLTEQQQLELQEKIRHGIDEVMSVMALTFKQGLTALRRHGDAGE